MIGSPLSGTSAEALLVHVAYLRALAKQEQAERELLRLAAPGPWTDKTLDEAESLWKDARQVWEEFHFRYRGTTLDLPARRLQTRVHPAETASSRRSSVSPSISTGSLAT